MKRGATGGAIRAHALLGLLATIDANTIADPDDRREFAETKKYLQQLYSDLLEHVHGTASAARTPDLMTLNAKLSLFEAGFDGSG